MKTDFETQSRPGPLSAEVVTAGSDELIVFVDDDGNPTGTGAKLESHHSETQLHLAFSVFLFNRDGESLLQQRAFGKKTWPGAWSNSCCGHLLPGESTEAAAARRLEYELGLSGVELMIALPAFRYRAELGGIVENEICPVLIGCIDSEPLPHPDEVNDVKWVPWDKIVKVASTKASEISPWSATEAILLNESDIFQREYKRYTLSRRVLLGAAA